MFSEISRPANLVLYLEVSNYHFEGFQGGAINLLGSDTGLLDFEA